MVKKIKKQDYENLDKSGVMLIDFSATWCGPCKMVAPVFDELSEEMDGKIAFYNVDIDESADLAGDFFIQSVPTLVLIKDGKIVDKHIGFAPKQQLKAFAEKAL